MDNILEKNNIGWLDKNFQFHYNYSKIKVIISDVVFLAHNYMLTRRGEVYNCGGDIIMRNVIKMTEYGVIFRQARIKAILSNDCYIWFYDCDAKKPKRGINGIDLINYGTVNFVIDFEQKYRYVYYCGIGNMIKYDNCEISTNLKPRHKYKCFHKYLFRKKIIKKNTDIMTICVRAKWVIKLYILRI